MIKEGDRVAADSRRIVDYLNDTYGGTADPEDRARHEESGRFRTVKQVADPPQDALRRLKEALAAEGIEVLAEASDVALLRLAPAVNRRIQEALARL